jgi:MoxR-like ATPase
MSNQSPRVIAEVTPYRKDSGEARCKVTLATGEVVPLHSLTRPELAAAARLVFPSIAGNAWLKLPSDTIQGLIRENDAAKAQAVIDAKKAAKAADPAPVTQPEQRAWTVDATQAQPKAGDPAAALADLISQLAGQGLDPEQVRDMVTEEVKRQVTEVGIVSIEIKLADTTTELPQLSHSALPEIVAILAAGLNVFMVGPAGSGKSTIAHQAADALGIAFYALSLGPTTPTSKLFGYMDAQGNYVRTPFREAYENGGVILLDELDNGHPGLVAEINQATANGYCAFADGMIKRHEDCRIVATGNTFGRGPDRLFVGRNILDAATLDRFTTVEILIDERLESRIARGFANDENRPLIEDWIGYVQQVRRKVESQKLAVIVSPRATIEGAKLLACGLERSRVEEIRLFAGMGADIVTKIR